MTQMHLMTSTPRKIIGLGGDGLEVIDQFPPLDDDEADNVTYLGR